MPLPPRQRRERRPPPPDRVVLGGADVDLRHFDEVVTCVRNRLTPREEGRSETVPSTALAIGSANLDHIYYFGRNAANNLDIATSGTNPNWLVLLDGAPLVRRVRALTGVQWPLLAGSDLLPNLIATADQERAIVGFLGGTRHMHHLLRATLTDRYPTLRVGGLWSPRRDELTDAAKNSLLLEEIRTARIDLLVVGLGKPRQERWIQEHAAASGARVLLAFGAAADFMAGTATRAPAWFRNHDLEWCYRLIREPRRLGRRYCLQAPGALWRLWTHSRA